MLVTSINEQGITYINLYHSEVPSYLNSVLFRQTLIGLARRSMEVAKTKEIAVKDVNTGVIIERFHTIPVKVFKAA